MVLSVNRLVMVDPGNRIVAVVRCDQCAHWDGEPQPVTGTAPLFESLGRCKLGIGGLTDATFGCSNFQARPR